MKKQFLLLFVAIIYFGISETFAQSLSQEPESCPKPKTITATCITDAGPFNPIAGNLYTYTANLPTPAGDKNYKWFVTTDLTIIEDGVLTTDIDPVGGDYVAAGSGTYNTNSTVEAPEDVTVDITWKAFTHDPTSPVLLVLYVEDASDCTNNNIEAYLIRPVHAFTLDIEALASDGTLPGLNHEICVSPVRTATYVITDPATGEGEIQFNYGKNFMYFIVTAANYSHSWLPRFQISGDAFSGSRTVTEVAWAYPDKAELGDTVWTALNGSGGDGTIFTSDPTNPVLAQATSGSVDGDGECIVVRITIENNEDETIEDEDVTLAVDGVMYDASADAGEEYDNTALADIHHENGPGNECPYYDEFEFDTATQTLTARPDINDLTPPQPDDNFVPTNRND